VRVEIESEMLQALVHCSFKHASGVSLLVYIVDLFTQGHKDSQYHCEAFAPTIARSLQKVGLLVAVSTMTFAHGGDGPRLGKKPISNVDQDIILISSLPESMLVVSNNVSVQRAVICMNSFL
jgi:hypothetical protein